MRISGWQSKRGAGNWRKFLTLEEADFIAASDKATAEIEKMRSNYNKIWGMKRARIVNRAIQRARYEAGKQNGPAL
jgi:hypothetical protein